MNDQTSGKGSSFWSAIIGAAVGATAVILSDKKTREMIKKKVNSLMEDVDEVKEEGKKKITDEVKKAKSKLSKLQE